MKCWEKAMRDNEWIDWQEEYDFENWCDCFASCKNPEPKPEPEVEVEPKVEVEVEVEIASEPKADCDCDGCYWGTDCDNSDDNSDDDSDSYDDYDYDSYDHTPRCKGYETEITIFECGKELNSFEEKICDSCVKARERQWQIEDDAVREYELRQVAMEEYQSMKRYGEFDGDEDGDREEEGQAPTGYLARLSEEVLSKQIAEDKKKRNF